MTAGPKFKGKQLTSFEPFMIDIIVNSHKSTVHQQVRIFKLVFILFQIVNIKLLFENETRKLSSNFRPAKPKK